MQARISTLKNAIRNILFIEKNGFRIALLNYTYGTNGIPVTPPNIVNYIDTTVIAKDIEESKAMKPDAIIACMHWGIEYQSLPDKEQKFLADWLIQKGVNHVIGSPSSRSSTHRSSHRQRDKRQTSRSLFTGKLYFQYVRPPHRWWTDGKNGISKDSTVRLNNCEYSLVWTARPIQSGKKSSITPRQFPN